MASNATASTLSPSILPPSPQSTQAAPSSAAAAASSPSPLRSNPASPSVTPSTAPASSQPAASTPAAAPSSAPPPAETPSSAPPASNPPATSAAPPPSSPPPPAATSETPPANQPPPTSSAPAPSPPPPPPPSTAPPPATSTQAPPPASTAAPPAQSPPNAQPPSETSTVTAPSAPPSTAVLTSIVVVTSAPTKAGETPQVITITSVITPTNVAQRPTGTATSSNPNSTDPTQLQNAQKDSSNGMSTGGKTAIAVVIPVVVVALLVLGGIFFWRKRKQRKSAQDERRKEVEEYGFNPNHDPSLPPVGGLAMAEDDSGYRGWGNATTNSNRKMSTTLASGMTYSDSNSNPGGYNSPNSPTHGAYSDAQSNDPLVDGRRHTMDSDGIGALGAGPGAVAANSANNQAGIHRGISNASSTYSAAGHSDNSGDYPGMNTSNPQDYYTNQEYYQNPTYGTPDPYAAQQQPIIRDVSARRNTRIENPSVFPQQGNSGIAQNF
ncbi:hypothetical protein PTT_09810 [Pyrenophora teres f. teres 0-1]|uniref:Uncharacterized protein n=2 Tax=Pyrenophora teres f. teres TaxID=97479 RepID=E3RMT2_PYRTT|nr:hypothetical protein PTT_09810 [Pyrenophora teres f. teres 0-1]KAE8834963.1 hypothetical protein PTNB85_06296 [Pyrenophora teres f. teres]KAE8861252.1 hypothetical protein PTNB29_06347 [Pyrenophora teres f. teres]CAA9964203.1 hypothetical protein PTMSG1_07562 [Pyrenophora teres f. maculata]CAE7193154.1 membrane protein [Pyrenophora teres f. teres]